MTVESPNYRRGWDDGKAGRTPDFDSLALGVNRLNDYERGYIDSGELEECSNCSRRAPAEDLAECVNSVPGHGRGPFHCWDCVNGGCCGPCQDADAREWQAEHGGHR